MSALNDNPISGLPSRLNQRCVELFINKSHVGHVFRSKSPYTHPGGFNVMMKNIVRVVDVWLDEFGQLFYWKSPESARIPGFYLFFVY